MRVRSPVTTPTSLLAAAVLALGLTAAPPGQAVATGQPPPQHRAAAPPTGPSPSGIGDPYLEHNGFFTVYVRDPEGFDGFEYPTTTYASITEKIEDGWFSDRGVHHLGIYGAWKASHHWLGIPPLDYFDAQVGTGTIADFAEMTAAAKARGINVYIYKELVYIHPDNPVFQKAAADKAAGVDSFETRLFRWDERPQPQASCPSNAGLDPLATWTRDPSIAENRCYVQSWGQTVGELPRGFPSFDFERPEAMEYAKQVLDFWMDLGVEGFIMDAPHTMLGMQGENEHRQTELLEHIAENLHPGDTSSRGLYLDAEGNIGRYQEQNTADRLGYNAVHVGAEDDFNTFVTMAARDPQQLTVDELEDHFATWVDPRRLNGRWSLAHSPFDTDPTTMPAALRALDAAVQSGGAGIALFNHEPTLNAFLDDAAREAFYDVFRVIDRSPALAPGASRQRVPTQDDPRAYAMLRRSMDGKKTALAVFNLSPEPGCVTVNLAGTGVKVPQRTRDLGANAPGPRLRSKVSAFALPAYGYRFLEVKAKPGFPWRTVDTSEAGWKAGGGWQQVADPSAFGGSRIAGEVPGGFARVTFKGRSIQGYGRMATDGNTAVRVSVDGRSFGVHSQRRQAPVPTYGGDGFYGQQLFSISGLKPGKHTLTVTQLGDTGEAGVDYLRVSQRNWVTPATPSALSCG